MIKTTILPVVSVIVVTFLVLTVPNIFANPDSNFVAVLRGSNMVPPVETTATGLAKFQVSPDGTLITYKIFVANIEDITSVAIQKAPEGQNGPVEAWLFSGGPVSPNGLWMQGTIDDSDLIGSIATVEDLIDEMITGNIYVNVRTSDNPAGEIRGQV